MATTSKTPGSDEKSSISCGGQQRVQRSGAACLFLTEKEMADMSQSVEQNVLPCPSEQTNSEVNCGPAETLSFVTSNIQSSGYSCPRCGNAYARPHSLNRHIRFECGVEPQFECPICHKKSKHKHNLVLHMRTHQKP